MHGSFVIKCTMENDVIPNSLHAPDSHSLSSAVRSPAPALTDVHPPAWERLLPYLLAGITMLGGALRFYRLDAKSLWLDEAFSVWMAQHPFREMLDWIVRLDQHPPLYYILLHLWMRLGDDPTTIRALSALLSTLTIPVIYALGKRLDSPGVGLIAALLLALSPFHVRFAQETRMYALLNLNASLAMLALAHLLTDPRAVRDPLGGQLVRLIRTGRATTQPILSLATIRTDLAWLGYMVFTAATLLTHNTAIFLPVATNLFVLGLWLWQRTRPQARSDLQVPSLSNWLKAQLGVFLLWSPWLPALAFQALGVYREFWLSPPTAETVWYTVQIFFSAYLPSWLAGNGVIWAGYLLLLALGALRLRERPARLVLLLVLWWTPFVGELLVSLWRPIFYDRTLIWASLPVYLFLATGVVQLRFRPYVLATLAILIAVNGLSLNQYHRHFQKEAWREAAAYVAQHVDDQDLILFNATWVQIPFDYYFRTYERTVAEHGVPVDLFDRGVLEPKMTRADLPRLRTLIRGRERVWLIYSHAWYTDPDGIIPAALDQELDMLEQHRFFGLEVRLYGKP